MLFEQAAIELIKSTVVKDGYIDLPSMGDSMFPLIKQGDICRFYSLNHNSIKKGDIILYFTDSGRLVAHRYIKALYLEDKIQYIFKGDANLGLDQPVFENQLLGKLQFIKRGNKKLLVDNSLFFYWGKIILLFPIISGLLRNHLKKEPLSNIDIGG